MKVGLFFGSFNPIHIGHLIIANHVIDYTDLDQVWFVVSPQNPLKEKKTLLADYHRLALVKEAIEDNERLRASDIEFKLPVPSYTVNTLAYLKEKYPETDFSLIMGEDNLRTLHKWKNYETILDSHKVYVYPRILTIQEAEELKTKQSLEENNLHNHKSVISLEDAPIMRISSSFIRQAIKEGRDVRYLLTDRISKYVEEMSFYK